MGVKLTNNARSLLAQAVSAIDTQLRVTTGHGVKYPSLANTGDWFPVALEDDAGNIEYCRCTARNNDVFTVIRGAEGSQPLAYSAGDACELRITVAALMALIAENAPDPDGALSAASVITTSVG